MEVLEDSPVPTETGRRHFVQESTAAPWSPLMSLSLEVKNDVLRGESVCHCRSSSVGRSCEQSVAIRTQESTAFITAISYLQISCSLSYYW